MKAWLVGLLAVVFAAPCSLASQNSQSKSEEKPLPIIEQKTAAPPPAGDRIGSDGSE